MEQQAREQAFITALTTEQFVLQAARSANISEMTGRAQVYMWSVSSSLIAFGFLAQVVAHLDPFAAVVLPAVFLLGEFTFAAMVLLSQMQRIRSYYSSLVPEADQFFGQAAEDERFSAAMATVGLQIRPAGMLFTGASVGQAVTAGRRRLFEHDGRPSPRGNMPLADWVVPVHYMRREVRFPQARTARPAAPSPTREHGRPACRAVVPPASYTPSNRTARSGRTATTATAVTTQATWSYPLTLRAQPTYRRMPSRCSGVSLMSKLPPIRPP